MPRDYDVITGDGAETQYVGVRVAPEAAELDAKRYEILDHSTEDVRLLLSYLTKDGKQLEDSLVKSLLNSLEAIRQRTISFEDEAVYWSSYSKLIDAAKPLYVDALRDTNLMRRHKSTSGTEEHIRALKWIGWVALISFIVLLFLLAYISVSESTIKSSERLGQEYQSLKFGLTERTEIAETARELSQQIAAAQQLPTAASDDGGTNAEGSLPQTDQTNIEGRDARLSGLINDRRNQILGLTKSNDQILWALQLFRTIPESEGGVGVTVVPYSLGAVSIQKSINNIVTGYFLPVFSALLGVCVFIMRAGSSKIENLSFKPHSTRIYFYRIVLGVIGGIVASWFVASDSSGVLATIAPAALAFLVGYSVEILFNILDSIVKSLGGGE